MSSLSLCVVPKRVTGQVGEPIVGSDSDLNYVLEYIEQKAAKEWSYNYPTGLFTRLWRSAFPIRPIKVIWIQQYSEGDGAKADISGDVIKAWKYDSDGLTSIDAIGQVDKPYFERSQRKRSDTPIFGFSFNKESKRLVLNYWGGRLNGYGYSMIYKEGEGWISDPEGGGWIA